jgi:hypothetical protein
MNSVFTLPNGTMFPAPQLSPKGPGVAVHPNCLAIPSVNDAFALTVVSAKEGAAKAREAPTVTAIASTHFRIKMSS